MKRYVGFSTLVVLGVGLVLLQTGCQSGWKISNPFVSHPRASSAETPEELDALDDVDELTPPPENYTVGDASNSNRSESLAQQGRYEVDDKASDVEKMESETRAIAEKTDSYKTQDSYQVADYSQSYRNDVPATDGGYAEQTQASQQSYAQTNQTPTQTYVPTEQVPQQSYAQANQSTSQPYVEPASQQFYAQTNQAPVQATGQSYAQVQENSGFQAYSAPGSDVGFTTNERLETAQNAAPYNAGNTANLSNAGTEFPSSGFQGASTFADNSFPTTDSSFPAIQDANASPMGDYPNASFGAAPSSSQPVNVAMNPESNVVTGATPVNSQPSTYTTGAPTDSDPYSDVYYAPQTTSSGAGFAPGSASGLY